MLGIKGGQDLQDLDQTCEELAQKWNNMGDDAHCTMQDLTSVMKWKFAKGKPRPLWKLLLSNSEESVVEASKLAFSKIQRDGDGDGTNDNANANANANDLRGAIADFSTLKGIGPASATAFLSLYRPDLCIFMDDEVIECLHDGKRAYTVKIYMEINEKCRALRDILGEGWTTRRVEKALWSAARISLCDDRIDLTLRDDDSTTTDNSSCVNHDEVVVLGENMNTEGKKKRGTANVEGGCEESKVVVDTIAKRTRRKR